MCSGIGEDTGMADRERNSWQASTGRKIFNDRIDRQFPLNEAKAWPSNSLINAIAIGRFESCTRNGRVDIVELANAQFIKV